MKELKIELSENRTLKIPKTGKIGRFAKIVENEIDRSILEKVMLNADKYESFNYPDKAMWWRGAIERLKKEVGRETAIKLMESCGRKCCGATHRKLAEKCWKESKSTEEFLDKLNKAWNGIVKFKLKDKNTIVWTYEKCYCGQVKQTKESFHTNTYCQCGVGWIKQLFESALGRSVEVEFIQSIISGAESCEFIIHI